MRLFRIIFCAAVLGASAAAAQPGGLSDEALKTLGTAELARRLLPPESAARAVSHTVHERRHPNGAFVEFFSAPLPQPDGTCRRQRYFVTIDNSGQGSASAPTMQVVLAPQCRLAAGAFFAHLQPPHDWEAALAALLRLKVAQDAARAAAPLPFALTCRSEVQPSRCGEGARAVLAALPLDRVYIVAPDHGQGRSLSVMPSGAGQTYWRVRIDAPARVPERIELSWEVPAPF